MSDVDAGLTQRLPHGTLIQLAHQEVCRDVAQAALVWIEVQLRDHLIGRLVFQHFGDAWRLCGRDLTRRFPDEVDLYRVGRGGFDGKDLVVVAVVVRHSGRPLPGQVAIPTGND